jgi:hypothetical protein
LNTNDLSTIQPHFCNPSGRPFLAPRGRIWPFRSKFGVKIRNILLPISRKPGKTGSACQDLFDPLAQWASLEAKTGAGVQRAANCERWRRLQPGSGVDSCKRWNKARKLLKIKWIHKIQTGNTMDGGNAKPLKANTIIPRAKASRNSLHFCRNKASNILKRKDRPKKINLKQSGESVPQPLGPRSLRDLSVGIFFWLRPRRCSSAVWSATNRAPRC